MRRPLLRAIVQAPLHRFLAPILAVLGCAIASGCDGNRDTASAKSAPAYPFTEVSHSAGVRFLHQNGQKAGATIVETTGTGAAVFDYDGDGWLDIFLINGKSPPGDGNRLFRNKNDGTFEDVTQSCGLGGETPGIGMGCAVGDYDADGFLDLFVTYYGTNQLFRNAGDGTFKEVTAEAGLKGEGFSTACAFVDLNGDQRLDLYVARYCEFTSRSIALCNNQGVPTSCPPYYYKPEPDLVYENLGGGRFREVSQKWGFIDTTGRGLGVVPVDYNRDGSLDLFVANDGTPNFLFRRKGSTGTSYENVAAIESIGLNENGSALANMGCDFGDFLNDGTYGATTGVFENEPLPLWQYRRNLGFEDIARKAGVVESTLPLLTFGIGFADFDNDGWLDLMLANGHVQDQAKRINPKSSYPQPRTFLRNLGDGRFEDFTARSGPALTTPTVGRGLCFGDLDNDGDMDLVLNNSNGPATVMRNDHPAKHWIAFQLFSKGPAWEAVGAEVTLQAAGRKQLRFVHRSYSFASSNDPRQYFGLGDTAAVDEVKIRWPDGTHTVLKAPEIDRLHKIVQPGVRLPEGARSLLEDPPALKSAAQ